MKPRKRRVARALLVSPCHEILLIRIELPERAFWLTPGGEIEPGEDPRSGLRRELLEETGRTGFVLGPEVWTRRHTYQHDGQRIAQHERFFLVHTRRFDAPREMPDVIERKLVSEYRWWTAREILGSGEVFAPRRLGSLLLQLLDGRVPAEPVDVGP